MTGSRCPLCSASTAQSLTTAGRTFCLCPQCDLIHVPADQHLSPDAERARYLHHHNTLDNPGYVATFDNAIEQLTRLAPPPQAVLDFGSGPTPVLVELLGRRGYTAIGYDPFFSPDADLARQYDAVISVETFEHIAAPAAALTTLRACLAPGAPLIIKTLFHAGLEALDGWHYIRDKTHIAFYSARTFAWIASAFDLNLIHHDDRSLACLVAP